MIIFDFRCRTCGLRFEAFHPPASTDRAIPCVRCGSASERIPGFAGLTGAADPGPSRDEMPRSWEALGMADPSTVRGWRGLAARRERLEEKYPELAGDRRPVLAHEGPFAQRPLRDGDPTGIEARDAPKAVPGGRS